jgi:hypothetical protein
MIEPRPLFVAQGSIQGRHRSAHHVDGIEHSGEPSRGGIQAANSRRLRGRPTRSFKRVCGSMSGDLKLFELGLLIGGRLQRPVDRIQRKVQRTGGLPTARLGSGLIGAQTLITEIIRIVGPERVLQPVVKCVEPEDATHPTDRTLTAPMASKEPVVFVNTPTKMAPNEAMLARREGLLIDRSILTDALGGRPAAAALQLAVALRNAIATVQRAVAHLCRGDPRGMETHVRFIGVRSVLFFGRTVEGRQARRTASERGTGAGRRLVGAGGADENTSATIAVNYGLATARG